MVIDLGAGYGTELAPQWRLSLGSAITLVNGNHMQSNFGVTPEQSVRSGHAVYQPGSGVRDARLITALNYVFDSRTTMTLVMSAVSLLGDAKDSPPARSNNWMDCILAINRCF